MERSHGEVYMQFTGREQLLYSATSKTSMWKQVLSPLQCMFEAEGNLTLSSSLQELDVLFLWDSDSYMQISIERSQVYSFESYSITVGGNEPDVRSTLRMTGQNIEQ